MKFIQYELMIYVFSILFVVFDAYIIIKIVLLFKNKKHEKVSIDWKFASVNIIMFVLTYIFLIISYLMLFTPYLFTIMLLTYSYRDGLHACMIVLFCAYFIRYLILVTTIKYSFFISNDNKIVLINNDLSFKQITTIDDKKGFIVVKIKNEDTNDAKNETISKKVFLKKSKLSSILLQKKDN